MSSGIPTLPKAQKLRGDDDSENEDDDQVVQQEDGSGTESGDAASIQSDTDDASTSADTADDVSEDDDAAGENSDEGEAYDEEGGGVASGRNQNSDDEGVSSTKKNKKKRTAKKNMDDDMTLLGVPHGVHFDEDDNEDDDEDADKDSSEYFQKLKTSVRESYVDTYHPETMSHNYDEIQTLARVIRNSAGIIVDALHRTTPIMTKYEKTRILGQRAKQINEGAPAFIKIDSTVIDGYLIAVKELEQKKTPFIIRRPLPNGGSEYWRVQDLEIL